MDSLLFIISVATLSFTTFILYLAKYFKGGNYVRLGSAISRLYLFVAVALYPILRYKDLELIEVGLVLMLLTEVISNVVWFISRSIEKGSIHYNNDLRTQYTKVLDNAQVGFYVVNSEYIIEYANETFCKEVGYNKCDVLEKSFLEFLADEKSKKEFVDNIDKKLSGEMDSSSYIVNAITADQSVVPVKIMSRRTENGHPTVTGSIRRL